MVVSNQNLDIDGTGANRTVRVSYTVRLTSLERHLASHGLQFREEISVLEHELISEPVFPGPAVPDLLATFPVRNLSVPAGEGPITLDRNRALSIPVEDLDEDPPFWDPDEIRCQIRISPVGFPSVNTSFTDVENVP